MSVNGTVDKQVGRVIRRAVILNARGILGGIEIIIGIISRPVGVIADNRQAAAVIII